MYIYVRIYYYPLTVCICRCDLEPRSNGRSYLFPSILVRSVLTKIGPMLGQS